MVERESEKGGGCVMSYLKTKNGFNVATYKWSPPCGDDASIGCVFLMHGIFAHICFEYLEPDSDNLRTVYAGSIIEALNNLGYIVCGHDHPGHGHTDGLRAYVDSFDDMRDAAIEFYETSFSTLGLENKHTILGGMSMGATIAIEVSRARPDLFNAHALFSPATRPPDDMFGLYGRLISSISGALNWACPQWRAIHLPPSPDAIIRDAVDKDPLVLNGVGLRVRMGCEFLRIYADIDGRAQDIGFKCVVIFVGENDNIVSPAGIKHFYSRVQSEDKTLIVREGMSHEVMRELNGREETHTKFIEWVKAHSP